MVIVGPMARFIISSCCQDQAHAANRRNNDFYTKMKKELAACCRNIKDFLFTSGHRNGRVMDPARSLLGRRSDHPRKDIYDIIAVRTKYRFLDVTAIKIHSRLFIDV